MKRKLLLFLSALSLSLLSAGVISSSVANTGYSNKIVADNQDATFTKIEWNNIDYGIPLNMPAIESSYIPQHGYAVLFTYDKLFNPVSSDNFVSNAAYTNYIKVNGVSINQFENTVVKIISGKLFIYFPETALTYTQDYYRPSIEVIEGASFYGLNLPHTRAEATNSTGHNGIFVDTTNAVKENVTYQDIAWNNTHYNDASYPALGGKNALLLQFNNNLSKYNAESGGVFVQDRNLKNTEVGEHISLNGTLMKDINGAEIRYFNQNYLWLYAPNMTVAGGGNRFAKIDITSVGLLDSILPNKSFFFVENKWVDNLQEATYVGIGWNNIDYWGKTPNITGGIPNDGYMICLQYEENIGPGSTQDKVDDVNMANSSYDIGFHLLINGVPCKDVSGAMVGSYIIATYLYIYFPASSIAFNENYYRPTIEIEEGCMFGSYLLPAIRLEYNANIGRHSCWNVVSEKSSVNFNAIAWNNTDYGYMGDKNGILLSYTANLSKYSPEAGGEIKTRNLKDTDLGQHIKLNGIALSRIDGSELCYYSDIYLWIYTPTMTVASNGYTVPHLSIEMPVTFLDVIIPAIDLNFSTIWVVDDTLYLNRTSFTSIFDGYNNLDLGNGYHQTILCFDKTLSNEQNIDLIATDAEFVNKVTLNGVKLKNVPGIFVIYMGNNYINVMIRDVDLAAHSELIIPQDTQIFDNYINETCLVLDSSSNTWVGLGDGTIIQTVEEATFRTTGLFNLTTGMCFENRINKSLFDSVVSRYGIENISFGTYIVPKSNYLASELSSPIEYVNSNVASSSTYANIVNTNKDFNNMATAESDGYYRFTASMYNIKAAHYAEGYIGIGYITIGGRTYYGNTTDNATTFYELMVDAYSSSLIDSSYFQTVISFTTTSNAYELNDNSVITSGYSCSYASKGYYQLSVSKDIKTIVIDGVPYKANFKNGDNTYFAYYNNVIDYRSSLTMSKGIGEPITELFPDYYNSNYNFDTCENVSGLNQAFGSDGMRIWLDLKGGLSLSIDNLCDANGVFQFDPDKVTQLHNYLSVFRARGITELTLLVSGWAYAYDSPIYLKEGVWYTNSQAIGNGATFKNIIPCQTNDSYQKWLDANEDLAYRIAKEFPEFKYIETANEIDGGGYTFHPDYHAVSTDNIAPITTVAGWAMDICHAFSKGVRKANSTLRVMTPAFSCVDTNGVNLKYNTKSFINYCYQHIENSDDTDTNNWFQVMNLHPYVFPTKINTGADSVYLWENRPYKTSGQRDKIDNTDYDTDWLNYMNYVHNTIMGGHHDMKKSVAITEFGFSDMGGTTDSYWQYINYNNRNNTLATALMSRINSLDYLETLMWFRCFDFAITDASSAFGGCYEQNFGLVEENKSLKELGKKLYQLWHNGSTDYSQVNAFLSTMQGRS